MNLDDLFKVKFYTADDVVENRELWVGEDVMLITHSGAKVVKRSDYEIFKNKCAALKETQSESAVAQNIEKKRKNPINELPKKTTQRKVDPEKKPFYNMSVDKLKEELKGYQEKIDEIKAKNDDGNKKARLNELDRLCKKWLKLSQEAIYTMLDMYPQNTSYEKNTIKHVIQNFQLDKEALNYDSENDCFND
jgi:hypothetical protein